MLRFVSLGNITHVKAPQRKLALTLDLRWNPRCPRGIDLWRSSRREEGTVPLSFNREQLSQRCFYSKTTKVIRRDPMPLELPSRAQSPVTAITNLGYAGPHGYRLNGRSRCSRPPSVTQPLFTTRVLDYESN